jgi:hypothetical protein
LARPEHGIGANDSPRGLADLPVAASALQLQAAVGLLLGEAEPLHEDRLGALDSRPRGDQLAPPGEFGAETPQVAGASDGDLGGGEKGLRRDRLDQVDHRAELAGKLG